MTVFFLCKNTIHPLTFLSNPVFLTHSNDTTGFQSVSRVKIPDSPQKIYDSRDLKEQFG